MTADFSEKDLVGTIPALRYRFLTRFYDRAMAWLFDEGALQWRLVDLARIEAGMTVLRWVRDSGLQDASVIGEQRTKLGLIEFLVAHKAGLT